MMLEGGKAYIQAGAGIVADSNPTAEYEETRDKARAMIRALELVQGGL
jgi:anthranilate synthase component 1